MFINEVEEALQMSSHTLRYYEKMGLIFPTRDNNGYRNYSDEDIQTLKKIRFLRELDIPIESIVAMKDQTMDFQDILDQHMKLLNTKMKSLKYVYSICESLKEKDIPLLDAMTNNRIIKEEKINTSKVKKGLKKVLEYLKETKTIVIGVRCDVRNFINGLFVGIFIAMIGGYTFGTGIYNMMHIKALSRTHLFFIITIVIYFLFIMFLSRTNSQQNYIELRDSCLYICDYKLQSRFSIILGMLLKQTDQRNKRYDWNQLSKVDIKLIFSTTSGGYSGLYRTYVSEFTFCFHNGSEYRIQAGAAFGEDVKTAYKIIVSKNIYVNADDEMLAYLNQTEKTIYEFFEDRYHLNTKKV